MAITKAVHASGPNRWITVSVENKGEDVAFMVHPRLTRGKGGEDVVPVFWSDNYFSLLPGEKKTVTAGYERSSVAGSTPEIVVDGWNLEPTMP